MSIHWRTVFRKRVPWRHPRGRLLLPTTRCHSFICRTSANTFMQPSTASVMRSESVQPVFLFGQITCPDCKVVAYCLEVYRLSADNRYRPIIGQFADNRYRPFDNRHRLHIPFEWMGEYFSVVRRQDSGTVLAGLNRILEFLWGCNLFILHRPLNTRMG